MLNSADNWRMQLGEEWIYRLKDNSPSERVRILSIQPKKTSSRVDIEFLNDIERTENVPGARLRGLWSEVVSYDELMANWQRIDYDLTETEESAVWQIFEALIPATIATCEWSPVRHATAVHDKPALEQLLGARLDEVLADIPSFDLEGVLMVSPEGTLRIAELTCQRRSAEVLALVMAEEEEIREKCKRGGHIRSSSGRVDTTTSPEWEYQWYLERYKPLHELLRQWCGHRR